MRIAILLTSNDTSNFARRFVDDGEKFAELLRPLRPQWDYVVYPVIDEIFPTHVEDYDAYIITGSPASVHDRHPWVGQLMAFIRDVANRRIPMIGICFGHQAIALALGGTVVDNPQGWVVGTTRTAFQSQSWMTGSHSALTLYAAHKEQVSQLPQGAEVIGTAPGCAHAAFVIGDHIMTTEYHPEMPERFMRELVDEMGSLLSPAQAEQARRQIADGEQGQEFAGWIVAFLEQQRPAR